MNKSNISSHLINKNPSLQISMEIWLQKYFIVIISKLAYLFFVQIRIL